MKKIILNIILLLIILFLILIVILSSIGIETNKLNKLIVDKTSKSKNINLNLETVKFKINLKETSLYLETQNPEATYRNVVIPAQNIKVYINFISLLRSDLKIKKINLSLKELDVVQLKKLSKIIKPSNFNSLLNNKIKEGKLVSEIEIFLTDEGTLENFIAKGSVRNFKAELFNNLNLTDINFSFFLDKNDALIKTISGNLGEIKLSDGDIKLNLENGIKLYSNFSSKLDLNEKHLKKYSSFLRKFEFASNIKNLKADLNNNVSIELDKTYKVKDYNYGFSGNIEKTKFELTNAIKNKIISSEIKTIYFSNLKIKANFNPKKINFKGSGEYSFDNLDFFKLNLENNLNEDFTNVLLDFDYGSDFELNLINYKKPKNTIANLSLILEKNKKNIKIYKLNFVESKNSIKISDVVFKESEFHSFKKIKVFTGNNNFIISDDKSISIKGSKFDATNLAKFFNTQNENSIFKNISNNIEIDFKNIKVPLSEKLQNFKLIGEIKKGRFVKISSKGDFGGNNFLDITMKKDKNTNTKYLEIYSDLTRPLLTEYSFFKGLSGGKLLFTSRINKTKSFSQLKIEDFKVVNAPGVIKLLSLADLRGLADLTEGEGLSFDTLEINMEKNKNFLKLNEILALGPSMSVLMEGYEDKNGLTSLRGTLVPAKALNNIISKIPVIGNIIIPKEIGEGLFGISFKMKGTKGKIKTTINPIKTLTPRFIQKIIEKEKKLK